LLIIKDAKNKEIDANRQILTVKFRMFFLSHASKNKKASIATYIILSRINNYCVD
jgi:hypothetical protein